MGIEFSLPCKNKYKQGVTVYLRLEYYKRLVHRNQLQMIIIAIPIVVDARALAYTAAPVQSRKLEDPVQRDPVPKTSTLG